MEMEFPLTLKPFALIANSTPNKTLLEIDGGFLDINDELKSFLQDIQTNSSNLQEFSKYCEKIH